LAAGSIWPRLLRLRPHAWLLILTVALGPGLLVNGVLKDHWGRPRPHQTLELGGTRPYLPPLALGEPGLGKSFPCGHSSAGYLLAVFFPIWLRRRPRLATLALVGALAVGTVLGLGRMGAGDHFLSDVIWSAVIAYGVAFVLYYFVLRIPEREDAAASLPPPEPRALRHPLATPVDRNRIRTVPDPAPGAGPQVLKLQADQAEVTVDWESGTQRAALIVLKGRGFGLPGARVLDRLEQDPDGTTFSAAHRGIFTEKDTTLTVFADPGAWSRIEIQVGAGDIRILPAPPLAPTLKLETGRGKVLADGR
jgi:hypothetical protein